MDEGASQIVQFGWSITLPLHPPITLDFPQHLKGLGSMSSKEVADAQTEGHASVVDALARAGANLDIKDQLNKGSGGLSFLGRHPQSTPSV